jgi:hypothetical protein
MNLDNNLHLISGVLPTNKIIKKPLTAWLEVLKEPTELFIPCSFNIFFYAFILKAFEINDF